MYRPNNTLRKQNDEDKGSASATALTAVAFQDHLIRSVGRLSLGDPLGNRKLPGQKVKNYKKAAKSVVDTGLAKTQEKKRVQDENREFVLDPKPPSPTLAQRLGLIERPTELLTEQQWFDVKTKSNERDDSKEPCVICKEEFDGGKQQVLLSCSHVFHRSCLEAFERFSGKKTCPMCRKEQYQTRVIHEGAKQYRHKCATLIQAQWRGYVVRSWYKKLRETVPPKDPMLRQKFYEEKLTSITERMIRSIDFDTNGFLREIDHSLEASRDIFKNFDNMLRFITDEEWEEIQLKAVERGESDCPICLTALERGGITSRLPKPQTETCNTSTNKSQRTAQHSKSSDQRKKRHSGTSLSHYDSNNCDPKLQFNTRPPLPSIGKTPKPHLLPRSVTSNTRNSNALRNSSHSGCGEFASDDGGEKKLSSDARDMLIRQKVLLSCSHVFHGTCLQAFEELAEGDRKFTCPICRANYQKKVM